MGKKKRRSFFDDFFSRVFKDFEDMEFPTESGITGYSIEVHSTPEGTEVHARVHGDIDIEKFKRQLEQMYPGARIVIETPEGKYGGEEDSLIKIERRESIEEERKEEQHEPPREGVRMTFRSGKPVIVERKEESGLVRIEKREPLEDVKEEKSRSKEEGEVVRITFKRGKPIVKKLK